MGEAAGASHEAGELVDTIRTRFRAVARAVAGSSHRPRVMVLTAADPLCLPGCWLPDMLSLAGGHPCLHQPACPPLDITWDQVIIPPRSLILSAHMDVRCSWTCWRTLDHAAAFGCLAPEILRLICRSCSAWRRSVIIFRCDCGAHQQCPPSHELGLADSRLWYGLTGIDISQCSSNINLVWKLFINGLNFGSRCTMVCQPAPSLPFLTDTHSLPFTLRPSCWPSL